MNAYNGYCYDTLDHAAQAFQSVNLWQAASGYLTTVTGYTVQTSNTVLVAFNQTLQSTGQAQSSSAVVTFPACDTVGPINDFAIQQIDPVLAAEYFASGFAIIFPVFAVAWIATAILNFVNHARL